jgi:hypothetical protein
MENDLIKVDHFGVYATVVDGEVYLSAIDKYGFPEQDNMKMTYVFHKANWRYTKRDKILLSIINSKFKLQLKFKELCRWKWWHIFFRRLV